MRGRHGVPNAQRVFVHKLEMVRVSPRNTVPTDVRWCAARSAPAAVARTGGSNDRRLVLRFRVRPGRPSSRSRRTRCRRGPTSWLVHAALQGTARMADCEAAAAGLLSHSTNPGRHPPSRPRCLLKARLPLLLVQGGLRHTHSARGTLAFPKENKDIVLGFASRSLPCYRCLQENVSRI